MKKLFFTFSLLLLCSAGFAQKRVNNNSIIVSKESYKTDVVTYDVPVHDPVMIKDKDTYYIFCTGNGIDILSSKDREHWTPVGSVFTKETLPAWHRDDIPDQNGHLWAPDIFYANGKYHLYYSVSAWMNFNSSIGYATNVTLDPNSPDYKWEDHGKVIDFRNGGTKVNCIDPNVYVEGNKWWLVYGSYQAGLRMVELNPKTGKPKNEEAPKLTVITPSMGEGVFLIKRGGWYYIFASRGVCCSGKESTYNVVMGRSKKVTGPFLTKSGEKWTDDMGEQFLYPTEDQPGRGHHGFFVENDTTFIVFHGYDLRYDGHSMLNIGSVHIDEDGWPTMDVTKPVLRAK